MLDQNEIICKGALPQKIRYGLEDMLHFFLTKNFKEPLRNTQYFH